MKTAALFALGLAAISLSACAYPWRVPMYGPSPGNPDHDAYAGEPGSSYDMAANPPMSPPPVAYNPQAPLPPMPQPAPLAPLPVTPPR